MIKFVYFDYGGVLTQSGRSGFITETIAELLGKNPADIEIGDLHYLLRRGQGNDALFFDEINKRYGGSITKEAFLRKVNAQVNPSHEVYTLAAQLRAQGIGTGLLSNVFALNARDLESQGAYDGFEPRILSCDEGYAKPEQELYDIAVDRAGVLPHEILFVDDQEKCLVPAKAMGMHVVQAVNPAQTVQDTKQVIARENGISL